MGQLRSKGSGNLIVSFQIDENWTIVDFANLFSALEHLLTLTLLEFSIPDQPDKSISKLIDSLPGYIPYLKNTLLGKEPSIIVSVSSIKPRVFQVNNFINSIYTIKKISYSSPGNADIIGVGSVVKSLCDLIKHYIPNSTTRKELQKMEIEILEKRTKLLKNLGLDKEEIKQVLLKTENSTRNIEKLIINGKIKDVILKNEEDN